MLERHELEAFLVQAEEPHFGRTAERLRVSAARISQTIAKPERRTNAPPFDRTSRRVEPTATGRRLYEEARPAGRRPGPRAAATARAARRGHARPAGTRPSPSGPPARRSPESRPEPRTTAPSASPVRGTGRTAGPAASPGRGREAAARS
ncbi:LysR family transcriptional regulator [Actinomadura sp. WMMB 499]|nr:LysR family transcriptional regulator [Actinomadura sp. WMMB 499]